MGIKLARAMGAHVAAFTTSDDKCSDARAPGAAGVIVSRNPDETAAHAGPFEQIPNTAAAPHDLDAFPAEIGPGYERMLPGDVTYRFVMDISAM